MSRGVPVAVAGGARIQLTVIDAALARGKCPPWNTRLGGEIFIHGHGHGSGSDWTLECVALDNDVMRELYRSIPLGTPVTIHP